MQIMLQMVRALQLTNKGELISSRVILGIFYGLVFSPLQYLLCAPEVGKYHTFDDQYQNHFYIAASQFYKMLLKKPPIGSKTIENQSEAIASIEYVVNHKTLKTFNAKKKFFFENF